MIDLRGKAAVVTGSSRGIGRATAIALAKAGCDVVVHFRADEKAAKEVVEEAERLGVSACSFRADVSRRQEVENLVGFALERLGRLDILVNNAGVWEEAAIGEMTEDQLRRTIDINVHGTFFAASAAARHMIGRKSGNIINISSTAGQRGEARYSHYAASKGAVISFTKSLATELAPHGIRVNCVAPGWVDTDMSRSGLKDGEMEKVASTIPLGRIGTPEELAGCVLFLASDLSSFVTGEILNANGGAVLCG